jgi:hypothetical protein
MRTMGKMAVHLIFWSKMFKNGLLAAGMFLLFTESELPLR